MRALLLALFLCLATTPASVAQQGTVLPVDFWDGSIPPLPSSGTLVTPAHPVSIPELGPGPTTELPKDFWDNDDLSSPRPPAPGVDSSGDDPLGDLIRRNDAPVQAGPKGPGLFADFEPNQGELPPDMALPKRYVEKKASGSDETGRVLHSRFVAGNEGLDASILSLYRDGSFELHWAEVVGCRRRKGVREGRVRIRNGKVYLHYAATSPASYGRNSTRILEEIRWDRRTYLVPLAGEEAFCNAVNEGQEPRSSSWGATFLHWGDWNRSARGKPAVPDWCRSWLVDRPLEGRIQGLSENDREVRQLWDRGKARLDIGRQQGLRIGMRLYPPVPHSYLVVVAVKQRQALAEVFGPASQGPWDPEELGRITVGQAVSTRRPLLQNMGF